ncbi:hypothetical protein LEP1GSC034_4667 [Leptospira interrogans str. 2003000735]|nr:hypothetical protein LEP1GSC027_0411 [Leptospira interrogans str. 2002000624]EKQ45505.1 hypothetical protein LEP1GSC026_2118 [Leptospira interrogans str. 2002000623]EMJ66793.1 hypothetical protein LEP1GSC034_4667 [Leptospira interrogans str. 2003000735]EMJ76807.1 hypothetical protein LEP1GSC032_0204 [Leptospira interrogans str. 2002000631]
MGFYGKTLNCGNSHGFGILQLDFELWELPRIWDFTVRL